MRAQRDRVTVLRAQLNFWLLNATGARQRVSTRSKLICIVTVFAISVSFKLLHSSDLAPVMHTGAQLHFGMAGEYLRESKSILEGHGILIPDNKQTDDTSLLVHGPGYAIFLSAVYRLFGGSYFTVQLVQNLLSSISPIIVMLLAGSLISWRVGVASSVLVAVSHHYGYYSNVILPDSLAGLPLLFAVYLLVTKRSRSYRPFLVYALAGGLIGLSVWLRPNALLMAPLLGLILVLVSRDRRRETTRAVPLVVAFVLAITPITIRNYIIYGHFIPVSSNFGIVLWEGIGEARGEQIDDVAVARQEAEMYNNPDYRQSWAWPDGIARDRARVRRSLAIIVRHPIWFGGAMIGRMGAMLKYSGGAPLINRLDDTKVRETGEIFQKLKRNNPVPSVRDIESDRSLPTLGERLSWLRPVARGLQRVTKETAQPFVAIGVALLLCLSLRRSLYLLMLPFYYLLVQSAMHTEFRYSLPMHYFLFIFAGATWVIIFRYAFIWLARLTRAASTNLHVRRGA